MSDKEEPVNDEPKVRKVDIDVEALESIEFKGAPSLSSNPTELSDSNAIRPLHNMGFTMVGFSGKSWKFEPSPRSVRSTIYRKNYGRPRVSGCCPSHSKGNE